MLKTTRTIVRNFGANAVTSFSDQIYCPFQPDMVRVRSYNLINQVDSYPEIKSTLPLETIDGTISTIIGDINVSGIIVDNTFQCVNPIAGDYTFEFTSEVDGLVVIILEFIKN